MRPPVADQQILRGTAGVLSFQGLDPDGEPTNLGTVTVGVNRADGTQLIAPGTATAGAGTDPRTFTLTGAQTAALDILAITWTAAGVTYPTIAEIVGGYYFSVAQARAADSVLADDVKYPTDTLHTARAEVEDEFEEICQVAFVPRYRRQVLDGSGAACLALPLAYPRRIVAVSDMAPDGTLTAWTTAQVAAIQPKPSGEIYSPLRSFLCGTRNTVVAWEHGYDRPAADIRQAALLRLRSRATRPKSGVPERATSFQVEGSSVYRLDTGSRTHTGIPDIDNVLDRWSMAIPGIA